METFLLHLKHAGIHNKYNKYRKTKLDEISTLTDNFSKRTNVVLKIKIINKQIITPSCKHEHTCTTANPPSLLVSVHRQPLKQHLQRQVCNTEDEGLNMSVFIYTCLSSKFSVRYQPDATAAANLVARHILPFDLVLETRWYILWLGSGRTEVLRVLSKGAHLTMQSVSAMKVTPREQL